MAFQRRCLLSMTSQLTRRGVYFPELADNSWAAARCDSHQFWSTSQAHPTVERSEAPLKSLQGCTSLSAKGGRFGSQHSVDGPSKGNQVLQVRRVHDDVNTSSDVFIYEGPLSKAVKNLKRLSITSCALSVLGSPVLFWGVADTMPIAAQVSIAATIGGFGIFTTSLLHWFTSPYVHRLEYDRRTGTVTGDTLSILAQPQRTRFHEAEVEYPNTIKPQVTFQVHDKLFFLDADHFQDKELLHKLTPPDPAAATDSLSSQ